MRTRQQIAGRYWAVAGLGAGGLGRSERPRSCSPEVCGVGGGGWGRSAGPPKAGPTPQHPMAQGACSKECEVGPGATGCLGGGPHPMVSGVGRNQRLLKAEDFPEEREAGVEYGDGSLFKALRPV